MRALRKLGRGLALGLMVLVGIVASLFIAACGGKGEPRPEPKPPEPPKQEAAPKPKSEAPPPAPRVEPAPEPKPPPSEKAKVDRKEVEKGQPLPRNYLE